MMDTEYLYGDLAASHPVSQDPLLVRDQLYSLLSVESSYFVHHRSCQAIFAPEEECVPIDEWRQKICQWCFRVIDHFRLDREVVSVGIAIFDRFLVAYNEATRDRSSTCCDCTSCNHSLDSRTFQLSAMTCLHLAVKIHTDSGSDEEFARRKRFKLSAFVELSRGQFQVQDIAKMEQTVLATLCWKVNGPTPMIFVSYLLTLMPQKDLLPLASRGSYDLVIHVLRELSRYLTELAVCLTKCSYHRPSEVAAAAILVSMDLLTPQAVPYAVREVFLCKVQHLLTSRGHQPRSNETIFHLCSTLQQALWPEMLLDECDQADSGHPIYMARECGLLDLEQIYRARNGNMPMSSVTAPYSPPSSPKTHQWNGVSGATWHGSPVSVVGQR